MTLASSHQVDMINGEHTLQQHTFSLTTQDDTINRGHRKISDLCLTDKLRHKRQQKLQQGHFYTPSSRRIFIVFCVITVLAVISLIIYFCWPRIPKLVLKSEKVERIGDPADWGPNHQPWLRAAWKLNMTLDNTVNFVPTRINDIELVLMDRDTYIPFAWSRTGPIHLDPYKETLYSLIFRVNYESPSVNDTTFKNLYNACGPQIPTESPVLNVTMQASISLLFLLLLSNCLYIYTGNCSYHRFSLVLRVTCSSTGRRRITLSFQLIIRFLNQ